MKTFPTDLNIPHRDCRLIVDFGQRGSWNMALDESLLESAVGTKHWTLRFYQWSRPTLSLGYFQPLDARREHEASAGAELVRRSTGGGAILHDRELTYSVTLPTCETDRGHLEWLYYALHETLIDSLAEFGLRASLQPQDEKQREDAFLCFRRRSRGDVLLAAANSATFVKIAGSAQRRSKRAVLQHGSVLLQSSAAAPELLGIEQLSAKCLSPEDLYEAWKPRIRDRLHLHLHTSQPTKRELARAEQLEVEKFAHPSWTGRR